MLSHFIFILSIKLNKLLPFYSKWDFCSHGAYHLRTLTLFLWLVCHPSQTPQLKMSLVHELLVKVSATISEIVVFHWRVRSPTYPTITKSFYKYRLARAHMSTISPNNLIPWHIWKIIKDNLTLTISRIIEFAPVTKLSSQCLLILESYPLGKPLHKDRI